MLSYLDDRSQLAARLVCTSWADVNKEEWRAVALTIRRLRREGKKHEAVEIAKGAAQMIAGGVGVVVGTGAAAAMCIYGGEPGIYFAVVLARTMIAKCIETAVDGVKDIQRSNDGMTATKIHEAMEEARAMDSYDVTEMAFQITGQEPCVVVERQRYSFWKKAFRHDALTMMDPPPVECAQFPTWVTLKKSHPANSEDGSSSPPFKLRLPPEWTWATDERGEVLPWHPEVLSSQETLPKEDADDDQEKKRVKNKPPATDEHGWVYSAGFKVGRKNGRMGPGDLVRQRRWVRQMSTK